MQREIIGGSDGNMEHMRREAALASKRKMQVDPRTELCLSFRNPLEDGAPRFIVIASWGVLREKRGDFDDAFLLRAAEFGDVNAMRRLLRRGADKNATNTYKRTPLMEASWSGSVEAVKLLLRNKVDVEAKDINGKTALMYAAASGHTEIVRLLLKAKAKIDGKDQLGETAHMKAAAGEKAECMKLLAAAENKVRNAAGPD